MDFKVGDIVTFDPDDVRNHTGSHMKDKPCPS